MQPPRGGGSLPDAVAAFLDYLAATRRASRHTLAAYRRDLALLQQALGSRAIDTVSQVDALAVRQAVATLHRRGLAPRSLQRFLSAVRGLFDFLVKNGIV